MNAWPVIVRELRDESRHPLNYWLRVLGAAVLLVLCLVIWSGQQNLSLGGGARLFAGLNATLLLGIWLFGPLLSADCLSGEKREGTLGLLFLTPLSARDIVLAKMLTHCLRALTLVGAALPVLVIPVLLGGVTWRDALRATMLDFGALVLSLTAGVFASAFSREWLRAMLLALVLSFGSAFLFVSIQGIFRVQQVLVTARMPFRWSYFLPMFWEYLWSRWGRLSFSAQPVYTGTGVWGAGLSSADPTALRLAASLLVFSVLMALLVVLCGARHVRSTWQTDAMSRGQQWLLQTFCTPVFWRSLFQRKMRGAMERNPIGWLQQRTWSARLTKWGWLLVVVLVECVLVVDFGSMAVWRWQNWLINALAAGMAFSAVGSFRQERETGALELLLVAPLTVQQIIAGRVLGIWRQFLPVVGFMLVYYFLIDEFLFDRGHIYYFGSARVNYHLASGLDLLGKFFAIPIIGLYFSMRRINFISAWLLTCLVALLLPATVSLFVGRAFAIIRSSSADAFSAAWVLSLFWGPIFLGFGIRIFLGLRACSLLRHTLTERKFMLA